MLGPIRLLGAHLWFRFEAGDGDLYVVVGVAAAALANLSLRFQTDYLLAADIVGCARVARIV